MRRSLQLVDATAQLLDLGPSALRFQAFALLRTRHPRLFALLWRARTASACLTDLFKAECTVLVLTARLSRDHGDAGRHVTHADGRVGRVHALSARTRRTERLHVAVARKLVVVHAREGSEVAVCQAVMFHGVNATASLRSQAWKPAFAAHSGERSSPPSQARSGETLKTRHWRVFFTRFHLIGSNPSPKHEKRPRASGVSATWRRK